jgi:hypothetical protein
VPTQPDALAEPRSFAGLALRLGALAFLPFALLMAWLGSLLTGYEFAQALPFALAGGVVFGTLFGVNNARFLRVETVTVEVEDARAFLARVNVAAAQLGYYPTAATEEYRGYEPSFLTGWAAGGIAVQLLGRQAVIVGPRVFVEKVVERLGLPDPQSHG